MGSICFSTASNLRCASLTIIQNAVLIIPSALEVIVSTSLLYFSLGPGRIHILLAAEGWVYLFLALLEVLSHVLPAAREDLSVFKAFDIVIGVGSILPIFLYMFFLYMFLRAEIFYATPNRIGQIAKKLIPISIPGIIIFNEVGSFVGITYRSIQSENGIKTLAIGFLSTRNQSLWSFFTSFALALVIAFQATVFSFTFYRLILAFTSQRSIEASSTDAAHFYKGIAWINVGIKIGAIETLVGFAGGGFGGGGFDVIITRRVLRMSARAILSIGLGKGLDTVEDFRAVRNELSNAEKNTTFRRSQIRKFISNPQPNSLRRLTPNSSALHARPVAPTTLTRAEMGIHNEAQQEASEMKSRTRRYISIDHSKGAPTLHMRLTLSDPPSTNIMEDIPELLPPKPIMDLSRHGRGASHDTGSSEAPSAEIITAPRRMLSQRAARATLLQTPAQAHTHSRERSSARSVLYAVRDLADQFPKLPFRISGDSYQQDYQHPSPKQFGHQYKRSRSTLESFSERSSGTLTSTSIFSVPRIPAELKGKQPIRGGWNRLHDNLPSSPSNSSVAADGRLPPSKDSMELMPGQFNDLPLKPEELFYVRKKETVDSDSVVPQPPARRLPKTPGDGLYISSENVTPTPPENIPPPPSAPAPAPPPAFMQKIIKPFATDYDRTSIDSSATIVPVKGREQQQYLDLGTVMTSAQDHGWNRESSVVGSRASQWIQYYGISGDGSPVRGEVGVNEANFGEKESRKTSEEVETETLPPTPTSLPSKKDRESLKSTHRTRKSTFIKVDTNRVKGVGNAPIRETPNPVVPTRKWRTSLHIQPIIIPPRPAGLAEIVRTHEKNRNTTSSILREQRDERILQESQDFVGQVDQSSSQGHVPQGNYF